MAPPPPDAPLEWFGSSGIRGPLRKVDPELGLRLGRALGATYRRVIVGHDARTTGPALEDALVAGLLASGADVTRVGLLPTPGLAWLSRNHDLGIQVTASHNPAPDNGYKLWKPNGAAPGDATLRRIEAAMREPPALADWTGAGIERPRTGAAEAYLGAIVADIRRKSGKARPLAGHRFALDCAHGAGSVVTPRLLTLLGAELSLLGGTPDGRFPDHPSEPVAEHLTRLARLVTEDGHTLGIAHDGDADRTVFMAPDGELIAPERLLAVLAEVRGDQRLALPVDGSAVVADHLPEAHIEITPVGDIHLSRALDEGRATLGCEPSGTWFFGDWTHTPEGPYAAALVATIIAGNAELLPRVAALPRYARRSRKIRLPDDLGRADALRLVKQAGARLHDRLDPTRVSDVDGARVETSDGWVLVRPSGTEPVMRLTAEAKTDARAEALVAAGAEVLDGILEAHA